MPRISPVIAQPWRDAISDAQALSSAMRRGMSGADSLPHAGELRTAMDAAAHAPRSLPQLRDGHLPQGIHDVSLGEFALRFGSGSSRRESLMLHLNELLHSLAAEGVDRAYVGGSFVTAKRRPGDVDVLLETRDYVAKGVHARAAHGVHVFDANEVGPADFSRYWDGQRVSMLEFMQRDRSGAKVGMARIRLDVDHAAMARGARERAESWVASGESHEMLQARVNAVRSGMQPHVERELERAILRAGIARTG